LSDFAKPYPVQFKESAWARRLLGLLGWRVHFDGLPAFQGVAVVYPHTSNWDAPLMFLVKFAKGIQVSFWGKDKIFNWPLVGRWLRWIGGVPVNRTAAGGVVGEAVRIIEAHKKANTYFWLGLAPEGTRKLIPGWRSGFYQTALRANVPLLIVKLDYGTKTVSIVDFIKLCGDMQQDMAAIATFYKGVTGFHPELASPIQILDPNLSRQDMVVKS
jgi:1-acyl-sn-glycerol-3-phosphate acyltransferase